MRKLARLADRYQRWRRQSTTRSGAPSGLLLLSCGGLGDTILFSHVIDRFLAYAKPGERVTVLLRKDGAKTAFLFPDQVETFIVDFSKFRQSLKYRFEICEQLYKSNYRSAITTDYLRHPDLDEVMLMATQCSDSIGMVARPWAKYDRQLGANAKSYARLFDSGERHQDKLLRWNRFADWLTNTSITPTFRRLPRVESRDKHQGLVLMQPFSAVKAKQYDVSVYQALIEALPDDTEIKITGAPGEIDKNPDYLPLLDHVNVSFEDAGFSELVQMMQSAELVVSVDTAAMHLSVVAGAPTLCLASAAYVGEIVPYAPELSPNNVIFHYKTMDCEGCLGDCIKPLVGAKYLCVADPAISAVIKKALALFEGGSR